MTDDERRRYADRYPLQFTRRQLDATTVGPRHWTLDGQPISETEALELCRDPDLDNPNEITVEYMLNIIRSDT